MADSLNRAELSAAQRGLRSRIAQLTSGARFLRGTLSDRSSKCGKPNCHCAKGQGHGSVYLVDSHAGKIRQTCVPKTSQELVSPGGLRVSGDPASDERSFRTGMEAPSGKEEGLTILRRLIAYAEKVFQLSETIIAGVVDRRSLPRIPTALVVKSVAALFWARMGSLNALELTAHSRFFHDWFGESVCSATPSGG